MPNCVFYLCNAGAQIAPGEVSVPFQRCLEPTLICEMTDELREGVYFFTCPLTLDL